MKRPAAIPAPREKLHLVSGYYTKERVSPEPKPERSPRTELLLDAAKGLLWVIAGLVLVCLLARPAKADEPALVGLTKTPADCPPPTLRAVASVAGQFRAFCWTLRGADVLLLDRGHVVLRFAASRLQPINDKPASVPVEE